jgi:hypothetical protein
MTGFYLQNEQLYIDKDTASQLTYTLDWSQWLATGDHIASATQTVQARQNDPTPLVKVTAGITDGTKTYIQVSGGQQDKTYTVFVAVTTTNGLIERRNFKVKTLSRSA